MTVTNFPAGISSYGIPVMGGGGGLPATKGTYYFVDYGSGSDSNNGTDIDEPLKTINQAYTLATSNADDVIVLMGNSTHVLTEMLTVSKNRVHFWGMDGSGGGRRYGQNAKVSLGVTTAATDLGTVLCTGVRCSFHNIKFINNNTVAQGIYCFLDGGEYTFMSNCEIYKSTDLDVTGAAELVANGDSSHYLNCYIGSTANALSGAIIRPCVLVTGGTAATGKKARDVTFEGCIFARKCGNAANNLVYGANATDVERLMYFKDCLFYNSLLAAADPDVGIEFGAAQTEGSVILKGCASVSITALSDTTGVFSADPASDAAGGESTQMA